MLDTPLRSGSRPTGRDGEAILRSPVTHGTYQIGDIQTRSWCFMSTSGDIFRAKAQRPRTSGTLWGHWARRGPLPRRPPASHVRDLLDAGSEARTRCATRPARSGNVPDLLETGG